MAPSVRQVGQLKISATSACACRTTRAWATCLACRCSTLPQRSQIGGSTRLTRRRPMMPVYIIRATLGMFHTNTPSEPPAATLTATARPTAATVTGTTNLSCSRRRALSRSPSSLPLQKGQVRHMNVWERGAGSRERGAVPFDLLPAPCSLSLAESIHAQRRDVHVRHSGGEQVRRDLTRQRREQDAVPSVPR